MDFFLFLVAMEFLARLFGFSSTTQDACDCPSCQTQRNCPECGQPIKITKPKMEEKPAILTGMFAPALPDRVRHHTTCLSPLTRPLQGLSHRREQKPSRSWRVSSMSIWWCTSEELHPQERQRWLTCSSNITTIRASQLSSSISGHEVSGSRINLSKLRTTQATGLSGKKTLPAQTLFSSSTRHRSHMAIFDSGTISSKCKAVVSADLGSSYSPRTAARPKARTLGRELLHP